MAPDHTSPDSRPRQAVEALPSTVAYTQDTASAAQPETQAECDGEPRVPGYEILGELGRGGMGVVYKARQIALQRVVALKMLLVADSSATDFLARFRSEAAAAARLQHANIVQLYEYGEAGQRPYFSLEYVSGGSLDERLLSRPLPADTAAKLLATLAAAMHFAHSHGVVHRDLKPANILIADDGPPVVSPDSPEPNDNLRAESLKIADFGLAKLLDVDSKQTTTGVILGTPSYMSPEQAAGRTHHIGKATDIYSLGAILYECLVGHPPFRGATPFETVLQVTHDDPVPLRRLRPEVPRDLETICMKCLAKEPTKRYATAQALGDDLQRFLAREPIAARPASFWERTRLWARRHPARAVLYASILTAATLITVLALRHQSETMAAYKKLAATNDELATAYDKIKLAHQQVSEQKLSLTIANGTRAADDGDVLWALPWFAEALRLDDGPGRSEVHRIRLAAMLDLCPSLDRVWASDAAVADATLHADGVTIVAARTDGSVSQWRKDKPLDSIVLRPPQPGARDRTATGRRQSLEFDPAGRRLLAQLFDGSWVFDIDKPGTAFNAGPGSAAWLPDGRLIVAEPNRLTVFDAALKPTIRAGFTGAAITTIAVDRAGDQLATGHDNGEVRLWRVADLTPQETIMTLTGGPVVRLQFSPARQQLLAVADTMTEVWDLAQKKPAFPRLQHAQEILDASFSPDGTAIATAGIDDTARLWTTKDGSAIGDPLKHNSDVFRVAFSPDSRLLATCGDDNLARTWNARSGAANSPPLPHNGGATAVRFGSNSRELLTAGEDGVVKLWTLGSPNDERPASLKQQKPPQRCPIGDGRFVLVSSDAGQFTGAPGEFRPFDTAEQRWLTPGIVHPGGVMAMAVSPDGQWVATGGSDRCARIWDWRTGREIGPPLVHGSCVVDVTFSHDGKRLGTASEDNSARVWTVADGRPVLPPLWHNGTVRRIRFSPDGRFVLTVGKGDMAYVWEIATGDEVAPVRRVKPWVALALANPRSSERWDLPADRRPVDELIRLAERLSGHRVDGGTLMPLSSGEYRKLGQK